MTTSTHNTEPISVSIIVACRNERSQIRRFLSSLIEQDLEGFQWEAIVADGLSDDGTLEIVRSYAATDPRIRVLRNPGRIVSTGLNAAIRAACGDVILRMDAHTLYARDYCRTCIKKLLETKADNVGGPARTIGRTLRARAIAAAYHSRFSTGGGSFHNPEFEGWVDTVPYGCWWKSTLERIGMFDEALVRNQDDELNLRLIRSGGTIWQSPEIVSWYSPRPTLRALFRQYFQYGFWKVAVIRKHRLPGAWRHVVPAACVVASFCLLGAAACGSIASAQLWAALAVLYVAMTFVISGMVARHNDWRLLPYLPAVFVSYHVSYGMGFLAGMFFLASGMTTAASRQPWFTRLSR